MRVYAGNAVTDQERGRHAGSGRDDDGAAGAKLVVWTESVPGYGRTSPWQALERRVRPAAPVPRREQNDVAQSASTASRMGHA
jgi:hypothetical protein